METLEQIIVEELGDHVRGLNWDSNNYRISVAKAVLDRATKIYSPESIVAECAKIAEKSRMHRNVYGLAAIIGVPLTLAAYDATVNHHLYLNLIVIFASSLGMAYVGDKIRDAYLTHKQCMFLSSQLAQSTARYDMKSNAEYTPH